MPLLKVESYSFLISRLKSCDKNPYIYLDILCFSLLLLPFIQAFTHLVTLVVSDLGQWILLESGWQGIACNIPPEAVLTY